MLGEHRGALIQALAQERFALTKEEAEAFDADAMSAIPQVAARIYYEAVTTTLNHINNLVPRLIENHLRAQKAHDEAENEFYSQFAALDRSKHAGDVRQFAAAFRGANPQIARQDLFAMIGAAVMAKYGLQAPPAKQPNGAQRVSQPLPFVPAPAGARGGAVTVSKDSDPFSGLDMNFDD